MLSDMPNVGFVFGYTNASWTLKADIAAYYFTQMINYMKAEFVTWKRFGRKVDQYLSSNKNHCRIGFNPVLYQVSL